MIRSSGIASWPPRWKAIDPNRDESPVGEIGNLEDVVMSDFSDNKIFLFMVYRGWRYTGMLVFDSPAFCRQIYDLLKPNIDCSIKQIGDIEVSHLL